MGPTRKRERTPGIAEAVGDKAYSFRCGYERKRPDSLDGGTRKVKNRVCRSQRRYAAERGRDEGSVFSARSKHRASVAVDAVGASRRRGKRRGCRCRVRGEKRRARSEGCGLRGMG